MPCPWRRRPGAHHQSVNHHHRDLACVKTNRNGWCEKDLDICQLILWLFGIGYIEYVYTYLFIYVFIYLFSYLVSYLFIYLYEYIRIYTNIYEYIRIYNKYYEQRSNNLIYLPSFWQFGNLAMFAGWSSIHLDDGWCGWQKNTKKRCNLTMALMVVTENGVCYHNGNSDRENGRKWTRTLVGAWV